MFVRVFVKKTKNIFLPPRKRNTNTVVYKVRNSLSF